MKLPLKTIKMKEMMKLKKKNKKLWSDVAKELE